MQLHTQRLQPPGFTAGEPNAASLAQTKRPALARPSFRNAVPCTTASISLKHHCGALFTSRIRKSTGWIITVQMTFGAAWAASWHPHSLRGDGKPWPSSPCLLLLPWPRFGFFQLLLLPTEQGWGVQRRCLVSPGPGWGSWCSPQACPVLRRNCKQGRGAGRWLCSQPPAPISLEHSSRFFLLLSLPFLTLPFVSAGLIAGLERFLCNAFTWHWHIQVTLLWKVLSPPIPTHQENHHRVLRVSIPPGRRRHEAQEPGAVQNRTQDFIAPGSFAYTVINPLSPLSPSHTYPLWTPGDDFHLQINFKKKSISNWEKHFHFR